MAGIIPFRGYRYDPTKVGDVTSVVAPPYDRVPPDVQAACYERSPFNVVRIIKGKEAPGDGSQENVYSRAAEHLRQWIDQGILVREADPALYAYHQTYTFAGDRLTRKGIIALGKLEPEKVHAHEQTLKGPKKDRLRLMRATEANFGHIFMLYSDPERMADAAVAAAIDGRPPVVEATDADGNLHSVWPIADREVIEIVQQALADKDLYIADGHHRYETAVDFMRESEANGWRPAAPESFDVRMMTLFNIDEPGMSIRPIHRLVHGIEDYDPEAFFEKAGEHVVVERHGSLEEVVEAAGRGKDRHTFGCVTGGVFATLRLRDDIALGDFVPGDRSCDYKSLDVSILHAGILDRLLGIDARALEEQTNVTYTVDPREGLAALAAGDEQILFYLNSTSADEVIRVADHGEKMPQKSTDFYPKLLTGLVLSTMEIEKPA
ncbi:DUF1015 domain-containing protein [Candidatus Bipolaricaulota bacterium]